jgi:allantoicase
VYDGWETRRHRAPGHDHAIVRLGVPGLVHGVVVDTSFFRGNYPPQVSVEALAADGYPCPDELAAMTWHTLVPRADTRGDAVNAYRVDDGRRGRRWTHVRLSIYPDGGVARFRVHGTPMPDPRFLTGTIDLAALENGGLVVGCSDAFYSSAGNLILPGRATGMAQGWENARRRGPGHDYVIVALAAPGVLHHVEIDTSCFIGNAPEEVRLLGVDAREAPGTAAADDPGPVRDGPGPVRDGRGPVRDGPGPVTQDGPGRATGADPGPTAGDGPGVPIPDSAWRELVPLTRVQPDTRHRFRLDGAGVATHVRLDVIPDGGLARLRIHGEIIDEALAALRRRWQDTRPEGQRPATADGDG